MAKYASDSPWFGTKVRNGRFLDQLTIRPVPASNDDVTYVIQPQYHLRPDLLAFDIYDNEKLWWVFAQRNMNVIKDPVYDFESGVEIFLPQKASLFRLLGS